MKAAIIGCGTIGTALASVLDKQTKIRLHSIFDEDLPAAWRLIHSLKKHKPKIVSLEDAIINNDIIIEAASPGAVKEILKVLWQRQLRKKIMIISTGGLLAKPNLLKKIRGCDIHVPSGAIAGLDAIKAVTGKIDSLELITTKPPAGLRGNIFLQKQKLNLASLKSKKMVFSGTIFDAVEKFPQNINVAASLYLASGYKKIRVSIIADPHATKNTHELICKGKFGMIRTITSNLPSPNPKTSYLALLSAQALIKTIDNPVKIGC